MYAKWSEGKQRNLKFLRTAQETAVILFFPDFSILNPNSATNLTENWVPVFKDKILQFASREKQTLHLLSNMEMMSAVLPVVLPTSVYKIGRKTFRPTFIETRKAFIDIQPIGTNMAEYSSIMNFHIFSCLETTSAFKPSPS
ncbi:hypothetical protein QQF64_035957 [Cirrhinus molitorella]|uniref:Uncharacterized protein n=1 Tax=Cirrhinus molitorella TaxID=172907 RepID=A0ABR3NHE7_9TELE